MPAKPYSMISPADYLAAAAAAALAAYATGMQGNSVATTVPPGPVGTYLRETPEQATIDTSSALPAPFIVVGDYTTTTVLNAIGKEFDSASPTVAFADTRLGQGDDPEAHFAAVARMEQLQMLFFAELEQLGRPATNRRRVPYAGLYAAELDGVGVQFTLTVPAAVLC